MDQTYDIDAIIHALYESISGPAGHERDWDRLRGLFFHGAHMIRTQPVEGGGHEALVVDVESYIARIADYLTQHGFYEWEIARRTDRFGHIAHVMSTYEARHQRDDPAPFKRGVNSVQLFHDGQRWWIINMIWDDEREGHPLPARYLPGAPGDAPEMSQ